jgi:hypothetical protein
MRRGAPVTSLGNRAFAREPEGFPSSPRARGPLSRVRPLLHSLSRERLFEQSGATVEEQPGESGVFDALLDLSIRLQPDGGMPGKSEKNRIFATLLALLAFLQHGHDARTGAFREHVRRILEYLDRALPASLEADEVSAARKTVEAAKAGRILEGEWLDLALRASQGMQEAIDRGWKAVLEGAARAAAEP